jgi:HK97 family phage prohead protease
MHRLDGCRFSLRGEVGMDAKQFAVDWKLKDDDAGTIEGYASTFDNWDSVGERPTKGAFAPHLADFLHDGFIAMQHDYSQVVASPVEAREDDHGLYVKAAFHSTPAAQAARTLVAERLARGKSVKLSIGYEVKRDEYVEEGRLLKEIKLYEWSIVAIPANPEARVSYAKSLQEEHDQLLARLASYTGRYHTLTELRAKEGRVLSGENRKRIETTLEALDGAMTALRDLLTASDRRSPDDAAKAALAAYAQYQELLLHYPEART